MALTPEELEKAHYDNILRYNIYIKDYPSLVAQGKWDAVFDEELSQKEFDLFPTEVLAHATKHDIYVPSEKNPGFFKRVEFKNEASANFARPWTAASDLTRSFMLLGKDALMKMPLNEAELEEHRRSRGDQSLNMHLMQIPILERFHLCKLGFELYERYPENDRRPMPVEDESVDLTVDNPFMPVLPYKINTENNKIAIKAHIDGIDFDSLVDYVRIRKIDPEYTKEMLINEDTRPSELRMDLNDFYPTKTKIVTIKKYEEDVLEGENLIHKKGDRYMEPDGTLVVEKEEEVCLCSNLECYENKTFTSSQEFLDYLWSFPAFTAKDCFDKFSQNEEQMMVAIKYMGAENILSQMSADLLNTETLTKVKKVAKNPNLRDILTNPNVSSIPAEDLVMEDVSYEDVYSLWKIKRENLPSRFERDLYIVECSCPSTNRRYFLYVDGDQPQCTTAFGSIAWTMRKEDGTPLTVEEWKEIEIES